VEVGVTDDAASRPSGAVLQLHVLARPTATASAGWITDPQVRGQL
jgi:hypothetical protein